MSKAMTAPEAAQTATIISAIERLLKEHMGLNVASIGSSSVMHAVQQRMAKCGTSNLSSYYDTLLRTAEERTKLIEAVVVPETWFFRAHHAFEALAQFALEWVENHPEEKLRILSVPCSTGEEPYSIAMTLLNHNLRPRQFHIDAVDISARNIRHAQQGLYGKNSFRSQDLGFVDRYFQARGRVFKLADEVMRQVNFGVANLLDPDFCSNRAPYQVIFCRNLLIYFDRTTQQQAIDTLNKLLSDNGVLFLGHAEGGAVRNMLYDSTRYPMAFAFRRNNDDRRKTDSKPDTQAGAGKTSTKRDQAVKRQRRRMTDETPEPLASRSPAQAPLEKHPKRTATDTNVVAIEDTSDLGPALRLANEGKLVEAASRCEQHLQKHGPNAEAFYLLALIREASGDKQQAEDLLRKAIYLQPAHYPSLAHIALLLYQRGEPKQAALFRSRAERCKPDDIDSLLRVAP